jgi:hypothetical protein
VPDQLEALGRARDGCRAHRPLRSASGAGGQSTGQQAGETGDETETGRGRGAHVARFAAYAGVLALPIPMISARKPAVGGPESAGFRALIKDERVAATPR